MERTARARLGVLACCLAIAAAITTAPPVGAQEVPDPEDLLDIVLEVLGTVSPDDVPDPLAPIDALNPACDPTDTTMCMLPFPSNHWLAPASTPSAGRIAFAIEAMPRNVAGIPVDPTEWNRNDGFSPGSHLMTLVPGLDLVRTWGRTDLPERLRDQVTDLAASLAPDAPIVLVDADTGRRHPFWSELDTHPGTPDDRRLLMIRPAVNFTPGHTYVVGLRDLVRSDGSTIEATGAFADLVAGRGTGQRNGRARQAAYDTDVFGPLERAGVARDELVQAWDFTVASTENLTRRARHLRDETFAAWGDTDLDDGVVAGSPPPFTVTEVEERTDPDDATLRVVHGELTVPNYLTIPAEAAIDIPDLGTFPVPQARFYTGLDTSPDALPQVNPVAPTRPVPFVCSIPRTVADGTPATPTLYGHGLLGSRGESTGSSTELLRRSGHLPCAVDWTGMSTGDVPNVAIILAEIGRFPSLADRSQQGFLEFLALGRALRHPDGLVSHPAFQVGGAAAFDPEGLVYDGNSQGAILGGALAALGVDFERVVLGVPGMNYSTLLNRSVDWEGVYSELSYAAYPDKVEQQVMFALIQMLWDRGETNGYASHITSDPLPDTPAKQVLLQAAFGDHQVANLSAEVEARTIGARRIPTDLPVCRHWAVDPQFGFEPNDPSVREPAVLAYFDSGTPTPPNGNVAPEGLGDDPHGDPRKDPAAHEQKMEFFRTGRVVDVAAGTHATTDRWPERAGTFLDAVLAQAGGACATATAGPAATPTAPGGQPTPDAAPVPQLPATGPDRDSVGTAGWLVVAGLAALAGRHRLRRGPRRAGAP